MDQESVNFNLQSTIGQSTIDQSKKLSLCQCIAISQSGRYFTDSTYTTMYIHKGLQSEKVNTENNKLNNA